MIVPGLPTAVVAGDLSATYSADQSNVDVFSDLGSPPGIVGVVVTVTTGVLIGSTDATLYPAMDVSGFASGSIVQILNLGRIGGMGGLGGIGNVGDPGFEVGGGSTTKGGGGGGGAGSLVGQGGTAASPATAGSPGTALFGGAPGLNGGDAFFAPWTEGNAGGTGGDAIKSLDIELVIINVGGEIWGGGGGGASGINEIGVEVLPPTIGGAIAQPGGFSGYFAASSPGYAVRGSNVTFLSGGSDPNVKGAVGS